MRTISRIACESPYAIRLVSFLFRFHAFTDVYLPLYTLGTFTPHRKRKGVDLEALPCGAVSAERVLKARDCLDKITKLLSEKPHAPHDESKQKDLQDSK